MTAMPRRGQEFKMKLEISDSLSRSFTGSANFYDTWDGLEAELLAWAKRAIKQTIEEARNQPSGETEVG